MLQALPELRDLDVDWQEPLTSTHLGALGTLTALTSLRVSLALTLLPLFNDPAPPEDGIGNPPLVLAPPAGMPADLSALTTLTNLRRVAIVFALRLGATTAAEEPGDRLCATALLPLMRLPALCTLHLLRWGSVAGGELVPLLRGLRGRLRELAIAGPSMLDQLARVDGDALRAIGACSQLTALRLAVSLPAAAIGRPALAAWRRDIVAFAEEEAAHRAAAADRVAAALDTTEAVSALAGLRRLQVAQLELHLVYDDADQAPQAGGDERVPVDSFVDGAAGGADLSRRLNGVVLPAWRPTLCELDLAVSAEVRHGASRRHTAVVFAPPPGCVFERVGVARLDGVSLAPAALAALPAVHSLDISSVTLAIPAPAPSFPPRQPTADQAAAASAATAAALAPLWRLRRLHAATRALCALAPDHAAAAVAAALPHLEALRFIDCHSTARAGVLPLRRLRSLTLTFTDCSAATEPRAARLALRDTVAAMPALQTIQFTFAEHQYADEADVIAWLQAAPQLRCLWVKGVQRVTAAVAAAAAAAPALRRVMIAAEGTDGSLDVAARSQLQAANPWLSFEVVPVWQWTD